MYTIDIRNTPSLNYLDATNNPDLECIVVDDLIAAPFTVLVDNPPPPYTTESCLTSFEGLPILVRSVGLPYATESALLATFKVAEKACTAGNKWMAVSSLTTFELMVARAQQLGRLSVSEMDQLLEVSGDLKDNIESSAVDCSSGTLPNILDWITSWFSLDAAGEGSIPGTTTSASVYPGSPDIETIPALRIYPSPTTGRVYFSLTVNRVEVYNMVGQLMTKTEQANHLDLHIYQAGIYVIRTIDESGVGSVHKVVKR